MVVQEKIGGEIVCNFEMNSIRTYFSESAGASQPIHLKDNGYPVAQSSCKSQGKKKTNIK